MKIFIVVSLRGEFYAAFDNFIAAQDYLKYLKGNGKIRIAILQRNFN